MKSKTKTESRQKKQAKPEPKEKSILETDVPRAADPADASIATVAHDPSTSSGQGADGAPLCRAMLMDITEHKIAEEAVRKSEEKYRDLFDNALEGVYQTTPEGRLISANMTLARMFGYASPEEMINAVTELASQIYAHQDDRKIAVSIFRETGQVKDFECRMRRKDGSIFWASFDGLFTKTQDGKPCFQGFTIDITARKQAEEEVRQINAELEQRVAERTAELKKAVAHLEELNRVFVGRELRMVELKAQIAELERQRI